MALSTQAQKAINVATGSRESDSVGAEIIAAINSGANAKATHVANVVTADATDLASAEALANANKAKINEILAAMQAAGLMA